ncbi:hypothetical protein BTB_502p04590 (plasmid) [Bacillus thuringiensis Bt407]|uniref:Uncharacterized protein n=1 Tax=Bacillus thuringiensis T01-328 TaxID=1324966 RepID=A0AAN4KQM9_BACTU|nr:hypothetical protein BTB_502p04590 [Bacillus thuringiensis Bt407]ERI01060.1 hypothetical protein BTCBT_002615 [Bacillus thuringiensis T01-328]
MYSAFYWAEYFSIEVLIVEVGIYKVLICIN